jgi:hypothetical protein|nr:MAG TPA_asm: hypothetical protein [Caudoviricetes sp.]
MTQEYKNLVLARMLGKMEGTTKDNSFQISDRFEQDNNFIENLKSAIDMPAQTPYSKVIETIKGTVAGHDDLLVVYGNYNNNAYFYLMDNNGNYVGIATINETIVQLLPIDQKRYVIITTEAFRYYTNFQKGGVEHNYYINLLSSYSVPYPNLSFSNIEGIKKRDDEALYMMWGYQDNAIQGVIFKISQGFDRIAIYLTCQNSADLKALDMTTRHIGDSDYLIEIFTTEAKGYNDFNMFWDGSDYSDKPVQMLSTTKHTVAGATKIDYLVTTADMSIALEMDEKFLKIWNLEYSEYEPAYQINGNFQVAEPVRHVVLEERLIMLAIPAIENNIGVTYIGLLTATALKTIVSFVKQDTLPILVNARKTYDLVEMTQQVGSTFGIMTSYYNIGSYFGKPYVDTEYMSHNFIPSNFTLYDANRMIFARNVDVYSIYQNIMTTIGTVPNTLLNDVTIKKQNLRSETNNDIVENSQDIDKNIYETLSLNFRNTYLIQDKNIEDDTVDNLSASIDLVNMLVGINDKKRLNKILIRFTGTPIATEYHNVNRVEYMGNYALVDFSIYCRANLEGVELRSDDLSIIYLKIDLTDERLLEKLGITSFEIGKIYNFTQMVEIV